MNARVWLVVVSLLLTAGCFTPRSMGFGQTGSMMPANGVEVGISPGFGYRSESSAPSTQGGNNNTVTVVSIQSGLALPLFEANAQFGLADAAALNLHVSPAGLQPGVKVRLLEGNVNLAVLPAVAFGYTNGSSSTSTTINNNTTTSAGDPQSLLSFIAGFKLIGSHASGVYGGLGYDFQLVSVSGNNGNGGGGNNNGSASQSWHNVLLAVGYDAALGSMHLRPELAVMISPAGSQTTTSGNSSTSTSGSSGFVLFANVTIAVGGTR